MACVCVYFFLLSCFPRPALPLASPNLRDSSPRPLVGHYRGSALFHLSPPFFASPLKAIHTLFSPRPVSAAFSFIIPGNFDGWRVHPLLMQSGARMKGRGCSEHRPRDAKGPVVVISNRAPVAGDTRNRLSWEKSTTSEINFANEKSDPLGKYLSIDGRQRILTYPFTCGRVQCITIRRPPYGKHVWSHARLRHRIPKKCRKTFQQRTNAPRIFNNDAPLSGFISKHCTANRVVTGVALKRDLTREGYVIENSIFIHRE